MIIEQNPKEAVRRVTALASFVAALSLFGCSHGHPNNDEFKPMLLSETVSNTIDLRGTGPASNLDKVYLVGYDAQEHPICFLYSQRVVDVNWTGNVATPKYDINSEDVPCPPIVK